MPALHNPPNRIRANSNAARAFGMASGGGRLAQRMLERVSYESDHAGDVLQSAPVLFWLFHDYRPEHIAEVIESMGSAKAIIRDQFELPKSMIRIRGPWPRGAQGRLFQFFRQFEPAVLSNALPKPDQTWKFMQTIDTVVQAAVLANRPPEEFDQINLFALRNWETIFNMPDRRHACDWLWAGSDRWPKKMNVDTMVRRVEAWDLARAKQRDAAETDVILSMKQYPECVIVPEGVFTLLDTPLALKEEGFHMNHCVGSYVGAVRSGRSLIYHFQVWDDDHPRMQRTTAELRPIVTGDHTMKFELSQNRGPYNANISDRAILAARNLVAYFNTYYERRQANFFKL